MVVTKKSMLIAVSTLSLSAILLLVLFISSGRTDNTQEEISNILISGELSNITGRTLNDVVISSYFPLNATITKNSLVTGFSYSSDGQVLQQKLLSSVPTGDSVKFTVDGSFVLGENMSTVAVTSDMSNIILQAEVNPNDGASVRNDVSKLSDETNAVIDAYNTSLKENTSRIVIAVNGKKDKDLTPACYVQVLKDGVWKELNGNAILALKVIKPSRVSDDECQNGVIEAWGVEANNVSVKISY